MPSCAAAPRPRCSSSASRAPFHATSEPPARSSGPRTRPASASGADGAASDDARMRSRPSARAQSSARAQTTATLLEVRGRATRSSMNPHLRLADSTRSNRTCRAARSPAAGPGSRRRCRCRRPAPALPASVVQQRAAPRGCRRRARRPPRPGSRDRRGGLRVARPRSSSTASSRSAACRASAVPAATRLEALPSDDASGARVHVLRAISRAGSA